VGGDAESDDADDRIGEDMTADYGRSADRSDPRYRGAGNIGNADAGAIGGERGVDYSSEMGGGAADTGLAGQYNENAHVRSVYDRTTDEPGSSDEGEREDRDETMT
jgi:hypothetical protein